MAQVPLLGRSRVAVELRSLSKCRRRRRRSFDSAHLVKESKSGDGKKSARSRRAGSDKSQTAGTPWACVGRGCLGTCCPQTEKAEARRRWETRALTKPGGASRCVCCRVEEGTWLFCPLEPAWLHAQLCA